jgi:hypothetical protein
MDAVPVSEGLNQLGVSVAKIRSLVREGVLPVRANPLDKREKLIPMGAIEVLAQQERAAQAPR